MHGICPTFRNALQTNRLLAYSVGAIPIWGVGQIARDWCWLTGLWFDIPSLLIAALLAGLALYHSARRQWKVAAIAGCFAVIPGTLVLCVENHWARLPATPGSASMRLVHWNVAGHLDRPGAQQKLAALHADIYVLSEIPDAAAVELLCAEMGDAYTCQVFGNLAVIATGAVRSEGGLVDGNRMKVQQVRWVYRGHSAKLLIVDLPSEIYLARDPLLREVNRLIEQQQPDLAVGDFNAPRRSWALCNLPEGYRHAYDTAGSGIGYTWPVPFPMFAIDQCIHSSRIAPARYELHSSIHSDHRIQVFEFGWN